MKIDISKSTEIIVFTGPESSGKTTCAKQTSNEYQLPLVVEHAREYLTKNGPKYTLEDIHNIASIQIDAEISANNRNSLIICDTDLVTLEIWTSEVFGCYLGYKDELRDKKHYLLCYPDIPWKSDPLRENPKDRLRLFEVYEAYLRDSGVLFTILGEKERNKLTFEY